MCVLVHLQENNKNGITPPITPLSSLPPAHPSSPVLVVEGSPRKTSVPGCVTVDGSMLTMGNPNKPGATLSRGQSHHTLLTHHSISLTLTTLTTFAPLCLCLSLTHSLTLSLSLCLFLSLFLSLRASLPTHIAYTGGYLRHPSTEVKVRRLSLALSFTPLFFQSPE